MYTACPSCTSPWMTEDVEPRPMPVTTREGVLMYHERRYLIECEHHHQWAAKVRDGEEGAYGYNGLQFVAS